MKRSTRFAAMAMSGLMLATTLVACKPAEKPAPPVDTKAPVVTAPVVAKEAAYIGKVPITLKHDVHGNDAKWAAIYAKEKYGAEYEVIDPNQDLSLEIAAVETFIGKGVDGIILHPVTEDGVGQIIKDARDAGVFMMTYNVGNTAKIVPELLIDEAGVAEQMGADMAKKWMELYPEKPVSVGLVSWTDIAFCFDNRSGPFLKGVASVTTPDTSANAKPAVFKNSKGEELTGATYWEHAGGVLEKAQQVTSDAITKYPNVNIVYGDNVSNGLGALAAYEAAGRGKAEAGKPLTEIIASTDASAGELIKLANPNSSLKYALGMQPQTFAYAQVDMMMKIINGEMDADTYVTELTPDCYFNFYKDSLTDMQDWFNTQYMPDAPLDLAAEIAKG